MRWVFLSCALLSLAIGYYTAGPLVPPEPPSKETVEEVAGSFAGAAKAVGDIPEPMVTPNRAELIGQGIRQWIADPTKLVGVRSLDRVSEYLVWQRGLRDALKSFDLGELEDATRRGAGFNDLLQKDPLGRWTYDLASQVTPWLSRVRTHLRDEDQIRELIDQGNQFARALGDAPNGREELVRAVQHQNQHILRMLYEKILDLRRDNWIRNALQDTQFVVPMSQNVAFEYKTFLEKEMKDVWEEWLSTIPSACESRCRACGTLGADMAHQVAHLFPEDSNQPLVKIAVVKVNGRVLRFTERHRLPNNMEKVVFPNGDVQFFPPGALGPTQLPPAEQIRKTYREWRERPPSWLEEAPPPRLMDLVMNQPEWRWFCVAVSLWEKAQNAYIRARAR